MKTTTNTSTPTTSAIGTALLVLLALVTALDAMAIDMYLPSMPMIAEDLGASAGQVQHTLSVFLLGLALGQGLYGPLLDRYGRRLPLLAGVAVFAVGSALAAMATSLEWLIAARFLQAIGAAAGLVAPRAIVIDLCDLKTSSRIFSLLMQIMMIAPILAPLLGGYLLGLGDWRLIFWVLAGLSLIALVWGWRILPDSLPVARRTPLSAASILRAYWQQSRGAVFMYYTVAGGLILGSLFSYISSSPFIFTRSFTLTPTQFSYVFALNSVALIIGGNLSNRMLVRNVSEQKILYLGVTLHTAAGLVLFAAAMAGLASLGIYMALLALAIGALGLVFGNLTALTMAHGGPRTGIASALMGTLHYLIAAVIGYLFSLAVPGIAPLPALLAICGALTLLSCIMANRLTARQST